MHTVTEIEAPCTLTFTQALARAEVLARTSLPPEAHGRIEMAMALARQGAVLQLDSGEWEVASQTTPGTTYHVNGTCSCDDAHYRGAMCKHRLSVYLTRRAMQLMEAPAETMLPPAEAALPQPPPAPATPAEPTPPPARERAGMRLEASVIIDGRQVKVALWGPDDADVQARLAAVLAQYPAPPASPGQPSQADAAVQCPQHGAMKRSAKSKGWYCPHKLADDTWCPHKSK